MRRNGQFALHHFRAAHDRIGSKTAVTALQHCLSAISQPPHVGVTPHQCQTRDRIIRRGLSPGQLPSAPTPPDLQGHRLCSVRSAEAVIECASGDVLEPDAALSTGARAAPPTASRRRLGIDLNDDGRLVPTEDNAQGGPREQRRCCTADRPAIKPCRGMHEPGRRWPSGFPP
jgi:hypothetical protein